MSDRVRNPLLDGLAAPPLLIILSGPSGVGKDVMLTRLREFGLKLHFVVTATSRARRPNEVDGVDYHFVSRQRFEEMIVNGELLEWAHVYGQYKGVPRFEIREALASGRDVILRVDVQGVATLRRLVPEALTIFLAPGSLGELRERLMGRRTESEEELERRLAYAAKEMQRISEFDYVVINHQHRQDEAAEVLRAIVVAEKHRVFPRQIRV